MALEDIDWLKRQKRRDPPPSRPVPEVSLIQAARDVRQALAALAEAASALRNM